MTRSTPVVPDLGSIPHTWAECQMQSAKYGKWVPAEERECVIDPYRNTCKYNLKIGNCREGYAR